MSLIEKASSYAKTAHASTNHLYDGRPYAYHLSMVANVATNYAYLLPPEDLETVIAACWCHDVIEDARQTYNDVKAATSEAVAEIVFALTNEKGRTRKERANRKYYQGIIHTAYAPFVKLCDRIANVEYSTSMQSPMAKKYKEENDDFVGWLESSPYTKELINHLNFITSQI